MYVYWTEGRTAGDPVCWRIGSGWKDNQVRPLRNHKILLTQSFGILEYYVRVVQFLPIEDG